MTMTCIYLNTATVNYITYCSIQKPSSSTRQGWNKQRKLWLRGQPRQENTDRPPHINRYLYDWLMTSTDKPPHINRYMYYWLADKYWKTTSCKKRYMLQNKEWLSRNKMQNLIFEWLWLTCNTVWPYREPFQLMKG